MDKIQEELVKLLQLGIRFMFKNMRIQKEVTIKKIEYIMDFKAAKVKIIINLN